MIWDKEARDKFEAILAKIPIFLRPTAEKKVSRKAENLALALGREAVSLKDVVDAFFSETPFGFHGPMKTDMQSEGIDYQKYGYEK